MSGELTITIHDKDLNVLNTLPISFAGSIDNEISRQNSNSLNERKYWIASTEFPPIGKKFANGQWSEMTLQEKVDNGIISLTSYKEDAYYRIENEAREYMDKVTTASGKRVSIYNCMMALMTMHYGSVPDDNPEKQLRQSQGFILASGVVSGMLDTLAEINAGVYYAKQAIIASSGTVEIDTVKFDDYI